MHKEMEKLRETLVKYVDLVSSLKYEIEGLEAEIQYLKRSGRNAHIYRVHRK